MQKENIKRLIHEVEHKLVSDLTGFTWETSNPNEFIMMTAYVNGVTEFVDEVIKKLDETECDCDENN